MVVRFINLLILYYPAQSAFLYKQAGLVVHLEQMLEPPCALYFIFAVLCKNESKQLHRQCSKKKGSRLLSKLL